MDNRGQMDPRHQSTRGTLRGLGLLLVVVGGMLTVVAFVDFFSKFGSFQPPKLFWCAFLGMPLLGIGIALLKAGYFGAVLRYHANEVAPVAKDTVNYMARETRDSVRTLAGAVREGLTGIADPPAGAGQACPACGHDNAADAQFCDDCGAAMAKACPHCSKRNDADARYCCKCGLPLA